jgi:hypothetical protein
LKPKFAVAPVPSEAAHEGLVARTLCPVWVIVALQPWVIVWLPAHDQVRFQPPLIGSPRLVTVMLPVNPVFHWLTV